MGCIKIHEATIDKNNSNDVSLRQTENVRQNDAHEYLYVSCDDETMDKINLSIGVRAVII